MICTGVISKFTKEKVLGSNAVTCSKSLTHYVLFIAGFLASVLSNRFSHRITIIIGSLIATLGLIISVHCPNIYFLYLTYGIVAGKCSCKSIASTRFRRLLLDACPPKGAVLWWYRADSSDGDTRRSWNPNFPFEQYSNMNCISNDLTYFSLRCVLHSLVNFHLSKL
jgi:hypothetical protein